MDEDHQLISTRGIEWTSRTVILNVISNNHTIHFNKIINTTYLRFIERYPITGFHPDLGLSSTQLRLSKTVESFQV